MNKRAALLLIAGLALSSLMTVESATAQSISKPSIPEFTAEYIDNSYDIAPTYTIDPYTNNTVVQTYGSHVDNRTVVITIKNEPFTPFTDTDGNTINMFYNVRFKGTFGGDWTEKYGVQRSVWYSFENPDDNYGYKIQNYASQNTVVVITSPAQQGQMDIQVEALQGYTNRTTIQGHILMAVVGYTFYGEESGWSSTQTITIGSSSASNPSPTGSPPPTSAPDQTTETTPNQTTGSNYQETPRFWPSVAVLATIVAILAVAFLIVYFRKRRMKT